MKFKTTTKFIRENTPTNKLVCAGYCDLQHLLNYEEPIAYTCGVYGWNYDVYKVNGLTICTGYRGMPGRRANNILDFEQKAQSILSWENRTPYEEKREQITLLLKEFCEQA